MKNIPCKVSIVNYYGEIIIDTLVKSSEKKIRSHACIHGITEEMLEDAPDLEDVFTHIMSLCDKSLFIGHSVK